MILHIRGGLFYLLTVILRHLGHTALDGCAVPKQWAYSEAPTHLPLVKHSQHS
ncbi:unnamed protein product [Staurois parvus]|uniref:Uncharacterized protein n=1 Tax=Staurois parvus TaxID=386267 RepID=A0ABN9EAI0_9NEOB|nr:unnamed protein product [Staurois parvus]